MKRLLIALFLCSLGAGAEAAALDPVISELMASSDGEALLDEDDDSSDWIELYHPGDSPVSLDGWSVPTVVYATSADIVDGELSLPVRERLAKAMAEAAALVGGT